MRLYELLTGLSTNIKGCIWCTDGSFMDPTSFKFSGKEAYGYALSDDTVVRLTRSTSSYNWNRSSEYCSSQSNAGVSGYLPGLTELLKLYDSIMHGVMKNDLNAAGLYGKCNYRIMDGSSCGWYSIWSSTEYNSRLSECICHDGFSYSTPKPDYNCVLPFFKF